LGIIGIAKNIVKILMGRYGEIIKIKPALFGPNYFIIKMNRE
jgi:hypothetical protein